jgi:hypothetical protein
MANISPSVVVTMISPSEACPDKSIVFSVVIEVAALRLAASIRGSTKLTYYFLGPQHW